MRGTLERARRADASLGCPRAPPASCSGRLPHCLPPTPRGWRWAWAWAPTATHILDDWAYNIAIVVMGLVCAARAFSRSDERLGWALIGAGIAVWGLGNAYWALLLADQNQFPSLADALWLAFYVLAYAGLALVFRARLPRASLNVWIDGAIAASTVAAVAAALAFDAVLSATEGRPVAVAVNLAYPIGDIVLLALVVAAIALSGWRLTPDVDARRRRLPRLRRTDCIYVYQVNIGSYDELSLMNIGWPLGCLLIAFAAWQPTARGGARGRLERHRRLALLRRVAIGVLAYDHFLGSGRSRSASPARPWLGVLVRLALTFRDHLRLIRTSRTEALTDA